MRTPPLLADFSHARACKPFCENSLTLPLNIPPPRSGTQSSKSEKDLLLFCVHFWQIFKSSVLDSEAKKCRFFQTAGRTQLSKRLIVGKDKAAEKFLPESPSILLFCGL